MPANVETYGQMAAFASLREPAWHALGTVFQDEVTTAEMLRLSHLSDWDVRLEPVVLPARSKTDYYATVRTNPFDGGNDVLGIVRERYTPYQNEDLFLFGDALLDGARWETAGSIKNGRVVFGSLAVDHEVVIDPSGVADKVETYLLVATSHDGSLAITAAITPVRVVCSNTLNMALSGVKNLYKARHTQNHEGRIAQAREALNLTHTYMDKFEKEAAALYAAAITDQQFDAIVNAAYPKPDKDAKGSFTKWDKKVDSIWELYNGPTQVGIRGTAWGAANALTERLDWTRSPRKGDAENVYASAAGFDASANAERQRLVNIVKAAI